MPSVSDPSLAYADSSALVKLVLAEPESAALIAQLRLVGVLVTSQLAVVEVDRAVRRGAAVPEHEAIRAAEAMFQRCSLVKIDRAVIGRARRLGPAELRTLDAIHLATAIEVGAELMVAYDLRLLAAAQAVGLRVLSPGAPVSNREALRAR